MSQRLMLALFTAASLVIQFTARRAPTHQDAAPTNAAPWNFLVVLADDIGVDRIGVYAENPDPGRTPTIDRLAQQKGVWFRHAWSNPSCSPTRATLLTGRYGFRTGIGIITLPNSGNPGLNPLETLLPEALGYQSGAVGKWHLSTNAQGADHPREAGFDTYSGSLYNISGQNTYSDWNKTVDGAQFRTEEYATSDNVNDAISMIESFDPSEPWFLYVAFNAPHRPLHVPPAHLHSYDLAGDPDETPADHFRAVTEAMDTELARLLTHVNLATTTVFFIGDNGTESDAVTSPQDPARSKTTPYENGINVPLVVAGRGVTARGEVDVALVGVVDVFATVLELARPRLETPQDSISMVPYLSDTQTASVRETVYSERFRPNGRFVNGPWTERERAVRDLRYKLIRRQGAPDEFYDLELDPFELQNLIPGSRTPEQAQAFQELSQALEAISG